MDLLFTVKATLPAAGRSKVAFKVAAEPTVAVLGVDERVTTGDGT